MNDIKGGRFKITDLVGKQKHCSERAKTFYATSVVQKCHTIFCPKVSYYDLSNHEGGLRQVVTLKGATCQQAWFKRKARRIQATIKWTTARMQHIMAIQDSILQ